jgi:very-short-patch-repair endonuclease
MTSTLQPSPLAGEGGERSEPGEGAAESRVTTRPRQLRRDSTDAERALWRILRNRQLAGFKFRRQQPLGKYIVDFICLSHRLIIEIDGGQHADNLDADARRTRWLESQHFNVIRFWNGDVLTNPDGVYETIQQTLSQRPPHPPTR